ncbi:phage tail protein [Hymenobacter sp. IS2118]|uniref:phage tail protein n=1 Tax=Hymenobacter sp. IS2118 TaxID=1505605 RepID=UPI0009DE1767|nr:tail fiber protein [Hymenobacter sp. IS2118]
MAIPSTASLAQPGAPPPAAARRSWLKGLGALVGGLLLSRSAQARPAAPLQVQSIEPYLSEIQLFPYGSAPRGWARCDGQLLPINQYSALFALLGTTYGGNGQTTFALPDLRGRMPIGFGQGPGRPDYFQGQFGGDDAVVLSSTQLPTHTHGYQVSSAAATSNSPVNTVAAVASAGNDLNGEAVSLLAYGADPTSNFAGTALAQAGASQAVNVMSPGLALCYCIALQGVFPSRS